MLLSRTTVLLTSVTDRLKVKRDPSRRSNSRLRTIWSHSTGVSNDSKEAESIKIRENGPTTGEQQSQTSPFLDSFYFQQACLHRLHDGFGRLCRSSGSSSLLSCPPSSKLPVLSYLLYIYSSIAWRPSPPITRHRSRTEFLIQMCFQLFIQLFLGFK